MIGRLPKDQAGARQLISVNMNRQCSSAISVIFGKTADTCLRSRTFACHLLHSGNEIMGRALPGVT